MKVAALVLIIIATVSGRIVSPGELARTLRANNIPEWQIKTWQCIAKRESNFDTAAYNSVTRDHGIFQISELFWCSPPGNGPNACKTTCASLRNNNINNDVICAKIIYDETQRLRGNGFTAWTVYNKYCRYT